MVGITPIPTPDKMFVVDVPETLRSFTLTLRVTGTVGGDAGSGSISRVTPATAETKTLTLARNP
jgi:hypothetical protein